MEGFQPVDNFLVRADSESAIDSLNCNKPDRQALIVLLTGINPKAEADFR
jgi:hypothetical protein